ncbi:MAG: phosphate acyltransferase PlsX [Ruminococcaceae bacterium]|nr:phosphate acyltransferase PlsX [Oscillospiraceae bacterium]
MRILVDIMSGDKAPLEMFLGAYQAAEENPSIAFSFIGNEAIIRAIAEARAMPLDLPNLQLVHTEGTITMEDAPLSVVREKKDSSMGLGLKMLAEGKGEAFVSAGNTGALHAGSTLIVRRIKGIAKSAIATVLPYQNPTLLIDSGANVEISPETYVQFAKMGSVYMNRIMKVENPRVGLLNIGAERHKGTKTVAEAYQLLEQAEDINFVGNVEGKELPNGACDVLVCDGFSGNIVLKLTEGCAAFLVGKLTDVFTANPLTKVSYLGVKPELKKMKKSLSASEYGGAPLLGLSRTVIKAHGSSDAYAFRNAIRQAIGCVDNKVTYEIAKLVVPELTAKEAETQA